MWQQIPLGLLTWPLAIMLYSLTVQSDFSRTNYKVIPFPSPMLFFDDDIICDRPLYDGTLAGVAISIERMTFILTYPEISPSLELFLARIGRDFLLTCLKELHTTSPDSHPLSMIIFSYINDPRVSSARITLLLYKCCTPTKYRDGYWEERWRKRVGDHFLPHNLHHLHGYDYTTRTENSELDWVMNILTKITEPDNQNYQFFRHPNFTSSS